MTRLEELAARLTPEERSRLQEQIRQSLGTRDMEERNIYRPELEQSRLEELVALDMRQLGFFARIRLWFRNLTSTKPKREVFLQMRLEDIQRSLAGRSDTPLVMPDGRLGSGVPAGLWQVYTAAFSLRPMFERIWRADGILEELITEVLSARISGAKKDLQDFISTRELQDTYLRERNISAVHDAVVERLRLHFEDTPPELFNNMKEGILPLYYLKDLVLFPFAQLLGYFGYQAGGMPPEDPPPFQPASSAAVAELLERLYYALYAAQRMSTSVLIYDEVLIAYVRSESIETPPEQSELDARVEGLRATIRRLGRAARRSAKDLRLAALIRLIRRDPYFRMIVYLPKVDLGEFYRSAVSIKVLAQLTERIAAVQLGVVGRLEKDLYGDTALHFANYRNYGQPMLRRHGLPSFRYPRALSGLYSYLMRHHSPLVSKLVAILLKLVPGRLRETAQRANGQSQVLNELTDRVRSFDFSLSQDAEDGKQFHRLRIQAERDSTAHRPYRSLVAQKDRDARDILTRGLEAVFELEQNLRVMAEPGLPAFTEPYARFDPTSTASGSSVQVTVERCITILDKARTHISALIDMDDQGV